MLSLINNMNITTPASNKINLNNRTPKVLTSSAGLQNDVFVKNSANISFSGNKNSVTTESLLADVKELNIANKTSLRERLVRKTNFKDVAMNLKKLVGEPKVTEKMRLSKFSHNFNSWSIVGLQATDYFVENKKQPENLTPEKVREQFNRASEFEFSDICSNIGYSTYLYSQFKAKPEEKQKYLDASKELYKQSIYNKANYYDKMAESEAKEPSSLMDIQRSIEDYIKYIEKN